ncbi:MAG TPA: hypothetical protein VKB75_11620 [Jatrophihabitans sp.]|nr:hypothetical protein [Jatrophihabitans sp.]
MTAMLTTDDRIVVAELAPVLRRAVSLDPRSLTRLRLSGRAASVLVRLPFGVLVSRTVDVPEREQQLDLTARAGEVLDWLDATDQPEQPQRRDLEWRTGLPPAAGWHRIETVPDDVIRPLVRTGALTLKDSAREEFPNAHARQAFADALLDSVVLTVNDDTGTSAEVTLRAISSLTRMGFLARGGQAHVDTSGRWIRVAAEYGSVYLERPGQALSLS